jgi:RNA 2',3'-cyclic 3'-phosphodiesterase
MRLFIAVPLPREIADRAAACLPAALRAIPALRPVRPELLHITLAFLGELGDDRLAAATAAARAAARGRPAFELALDHAGCFPRSGRPSALWLGVSAGAGELTGLAADLRRELTGRSFTLEARPFSAHLTLARVRSDVSGPASRAISTAIDHVVVTDLHLRVDRIAVVESRLSRHGPTYTARAEVALG